MATRASIEMDFNKARTQANKLDDIANNLKNCQATIFRSPCKICQDVGKGVMRLHI
jgi:hypothetical protein